MKHSQKILRAMKTLDQGISSGSQGLGEKLFLLVSKLTPLINVDLLIKNRKGEVLLCYREDAFYKGWHIPGGVIRFKESVKERLQGTARKELGAVLRSWSGPLAVFEKICWDRDVRGHFIAMLYLCRLKSGPRPSLRCIDLRAPRGGQWAWFRSAPRNLLTQHRVYRPYFSR